MTGDQPAIYPSSDTAERGFCAKCGSTISFRYLEHADRIAMASACFDDPNAVDPSAHIWVKRRLDWVKLADGLPEHQEWKPKK